MKVHQKRLYVSQFFKTTLYGKSVLINDFVSIKSVLIKFNKLNKTNQQIVKPLLIMTKRLNKIKSLLIKIKRLNKIKSLLIKINGLDQINH